MHWIKVDKFGDPPLEFPVFLIDKYENIHIGYGTFDYYDAEYWFPIPALPMENQVITHDECINKLVKNEEELVQDKK